MLGCLNAIHSPEADPDEQEDATTAAADESTATQGNDNTCTICMEEWTVGSSHRICCLACGHLFGRNCIEHWIKEKDVNAKCPICNKPAKKSHIRNLWVKSIKAQDNSDVTELNQLLNNERKLRKTDSAKIFNQNLKIEMLESHIDRLKRAVIDKEHKIARMEAVLDQGMKRRRVTNNPISEDENSVQSIIDLDTDEIIAPTEIKGTFHINDKFESSPAGKCRSIAISSTNRVILVSQLSPTRSIFDEYGLRKYSLIDTKIREFIPLHKKFINAMDLKPIGDLILTASADKRIRITSIHNNICIQEYNSTYDPVGVAWSVNRSQQFYVLTQLGYAQLYDMRNTNEHIYQSSAKVSSSRPISISATNEPEGILVNDARGSQFIEISEGSHYDSGMIDREAEHFKTHSLPFSGSMGTVDYHVDKKLALISCRKTADTSNCVHHLSTLRKDIDDTDQMIGVELGDIKTFQGGSASECLSHSKILRHPTIDDSVLVGAWDGSANGIKLWDSSDSSVYQTIRTNSFIRDMTMYTPENSNQHLLYTLGDKDIAVYKWDYA